MGLPLVTQGVAGDCPKVSGVIVEGGFSSILDVAKEAMPLLLPQVSLAPLFHSSATLLRQGAHGVDPMNQSDS